MNSLCRRSYVLEAQDDHTQITWPSGFTQTRGVRAAWVLLLLPQNDNLPNKVKYKSKYKSMYFKAKRVWINRWEGRGSHQHRIVTCPGPPTPARSPLINSYMTGLIPQDHDSDWHLNEGAGASLLQAPFHGCALCPPPPPTPPYRVETSPFFFWSRESCDGQIQGGPLVMPHCPSIGVWVIAHKNWLAPYTSFLHMNERPIVRP